MNKQLKIVIHALLLSLCAHINFANAEAPPTHVIFFDQIKTNESFAKGESLLVNDHYKIITGRRVEPGQVEVHEHDTDIINVIEGAATIVVGGSGRDMKIEKPGELRGQSINNGTTYHLVKGDVIVIPKRIPHWFTEVDSTFLYFIVKVTE